MKIKGEYRDVLSRDGAVIVDTGWRSNAIVNDYSRFLAALMKKDFINEKVGIEYMAVGSGSKDYAEFRGKVEGFFDSGRPEQLPKPTSKDNWVWAKKIEGGDINYINDEDKVVNDITNRLRIEVTFIKEEEGEEKEPEPSEETLEFREFALLGIDKNSGGTFDTDKMFFINYVDHGPITKDKSMELTRTVILTFPVKEEVVS